MSKPTYIVANVRHGAFGTIPPGGPGGPEDQSLFQIQIQGFASKYCFATLLCHDNNYSHEHAPDDLDGRKDQADKDAPDDLDGLDDQADYDNSKADQIRSSLSWASS